MIMTPVTAMNVSEAIRARSSVRAFLPTEIPAHRVKAILETARRAPSGGNLQPWRVHAVSGDVLAALKNSVAKKLQEEIAGEKSEHDVYPPRLWEPYRSHRDQCGEDLYGMIGIERDDHEGRIDQFLRNYTLFGAPVGLFFTIDRRMGPPQWADLGMYVLAVMLLAYEQGIDTCAQGAWARFPETVRRVLGYGEDEMLFCGMAMGYRDPDAPINALRTRRAVFEEYATLKGFGTRAAPPQDRA